MAQTLTLYRHQHLRQKSCGFPQGPCHFYGPKKPIAIIKRPCIFAVCRKNQMSIATASRGQEAPNRRASVRRLLLQGASNQMAVGLAVVNGVTVSAPGIANNFITGLIGINPENTSTDASIPVAIRHFTGVVGTVAAL